MSKLKKRFLRGGLFEDVVGVQCEAKGIRLMESTRGECQPLIIEHHYSHTCPANSQYFLAVFHDDRLAGAIALGVGIRPAVNGTKKGSHVEFDRMWLDDSMPKFSETIVISMLHMWIRERLPDVVTVTSYADEGAGMTGTIYRAANYTEVARTPVDMYVDEEGNRIHPVTMWHRYGTRAEDAIKELGITREKSGKDQIKFEFEL